VILPELLSENLYDVPEDSLVISESDKDNSVRERKIVCPKQCYSERQTSSEEHDDSSDT
jgi:ferredoxin-like protein FixX